MVKVRGLRSSNDAKPWRCRCGNVNRPTKHRFFDLPAFRCRSCRKKYDGNFKFCLGEIEAEGGSLIGEVKDQKEKPHCVAYAYCKAVEISERVFNVNNQIDPNEVECINPDELQQVFQEKFPNFSAADFLSRDFGIHKIIHMGLILREEGIQRETSRDMHKAEDLSAIARDDFEEIARLLADGVPLVATYHVGKRRGHLKYCQIYKSPPREKGQRYCGHAVVLIGAGMKNGRRFFYFLNSWGDRFCPRKNVRGEIKMSGIGKIRARDLTKNVIKLSQPHKTDAGWRLEAQNESDISKDNYFLMMATKKQYACVTSRKAKLANDFKKIREDHLINGAFCDDEAEYLQASEDRYNEPEACSTEMEGHPVEEDLCDILHHGQSASAQTDHTIHSVRGVAQPATSSAPASTSHRASRTPISGPAGGVGDLYIGFGATETATATSMPCGLFGTGFPEFDQMQQQLTQNANLLREMMNMPMVQNLMNNPDLICNVNVNTTGMCEIIDRNPDIAQVLNDPIVISQTFEAARNPEILTKMIQNTDRAMGNIESSPEGLNMLWNMYETAQEPFLSTTTMCGEGNTTSNPSTALLGNQGSNQPSNPATIAPITGSESSTGTPAPNTNPLPNPWSTNGMHEIIDRNPDIAHVLNDRIILCQTLEAARNTEILTEMRRNTDRAMNNIESSPEGFSMLRYMYETIKEPFLSTTTMCAEGNTALNPSAARRGNQGSNQPSNPATIAPTTGSESTTGTLAPNTNPLPNPWSTNAGGAQEATRSGPAGNIRNSATGGLGGLGSAEFSSMLGGLAGNATAGTAGGLGELGSADMETIRGCLPDASPLSQIMQNPAIIQIVMSDPQWMNQLLSINTNASNRVESNNQTREMFQNPEFLHQLKSPETLQQLLSFQQTLSLLGQHQPSQDGNKGSNGTGTRGNDGFGTLMGMLSGPGAGGGICVPNTSNVPPEELCATQLTWLQEMDFINTAENIRALILAVS